MKTANGVILLPHQHADTHAPPLSADWATDDGDYLFSTSHLLPPMSPLGFFFLIAAMVVVASLGIRIALLSGRTTALRWQQQTPLSPLALTGRGIGGKKGAERFVGSRLAVVDEEVGRLDEEEEGRMKFG